jgi:hypothetical protein
MFGSGIVCGLNVVNLDDLSILIESGVAIDEAGHEIVVPTTVIKRLSGLEGYENLASDSVGLYIRYKEEPVHSVYCGDIGSNGKEYEYNRIDEEYEFYLHDLESSEYSYTENEEIISKEKILDNEDYTVYISMPYKVAKGKSVKIEVNIHKNSDAEKNIYFAAKLQLPAFSDYEENHELNVVVDNLYLEKGKTVKKEYWINADRTDAKEANILARKEDMRFVIGGYDVEPGCGLNVKVLLSDQSPYDLSSNEVGKVNLEDDLRLGGEQGVCIAKLMLLRTEANSLIGEIIEDGVKKYIRTPAKMEQRHDYMSYFRNRDSFKQGATVKNDFMKKDDGQMDMPLFMASGRLEIPLDVNMKKGDVCYSEEIMHGLGKGNVYVEVGLEYINDDLLSKNNRRNTIYGNPRLFDFPECMEIETAVRVLNDKGSFQVAVKLLGEQKSIVVQLNWVAVKFSSTKDASEIQEEDNRSIIPETPTVRLKAKESYYFNVNFNNMKPCRLSYELTEAGSGEIEADGMYTAPSKEGVYEIYIYCTDMPKISTYVYAIVSK